MTSISLVRLLCKNERSPSLRLESCKSVPLLSHTSLTKFVGYMSTLSDLFEIGCDYSSSPGRGVLG